MTSSATFTRPTEVVSAMEDCKGLKVYSSHQSSFLPWLGYWDKVKQSDYFNVGIYDLYTPKTWIGYTYIGDKNKKVKWGPPLEEYHSTTKVNEIKVKKEFADAMLIKFKECHGEDEHFEDIFPLLRDLLLSVERLTYLWQVNLVLFYGVYNFLSLKSRVVLSPKNQDIQTTEDIVSWVEKYCCNAYYSGPHGTDYLDISLFEKNKVTVKFQDTTQLYRDYPVSVMSIISKHGFSKMFNILDSIAQIDGCIKNE